MAKPLVENINDIRLGIIGMTPGNGHPFSWSAIFNNYDPDAMSRIPYPGIVEYLGKEDRAGIGIDGAAVTHIYCDDRRDAEQVAAASLVANIVDRPEEMIGQVDAVIIATDIGGEHVRRARPFVESGVPLFIDKPLCDNDNDLETFAGWINGGAKILSGSARRYDKEIAPYHRRTSEIGKLRHIYMPMGKSWETYGIHALEAIFPILGPGFTSVRNIGDREHNIVHLTHGCGCRVTIACIKDLKYGGPIQLGGTAGHITITTRDTYYLFRAQLLAFTGYLRTGIPPFEFSETHELMRLLIGGIHSRDNGNIEVQI